LGQRVYEGSAKAETDERPDIALICEQETADSSTADREAG